MRKTGKTRKNCVPVHTVANTYVCILLAEGKQRSKEPGISDSYLPNSSALQQQEFGPWS